MPRRGSTVRCTDSFHVWDAGGCAKTRGGRPTDGLSLGITVRMRRHTASLAAWAALIVTVEAALASPETVTGRGGGVAWVAAIALAAGGLVTGLLKRRVRRLERTVQRGTERLQANERFTRALPE